jgi:hypothetical protein
MSEEPEQNPENTPEEFLKEISIKLGSPNGPARLAAIKELVSQKYSSQAILHTLEELALKDKSKSVREAALLALDTPTHRFIRKKGSGLNNRDRKIILNELADLEFQGLIQPEQADIIRQRYDFDIRPAPPEI